MYFLNFFAILHCIQIWLLSKRLPSEAWREYRFWSQLRRQIDFSWNIHEKQCRTTTVFPFAILNTKSKNNKIHLGGQKYALQHGGQYRSYYFIENQNGSTSLFINAFPLKFQVYENFYVLYQFLVSARFQPRDSPVATHCLKEALVMWPLSASGLLPRFVRTRSGICSKIRSLWVAF